MNPESSPMDHPPSSSRTPSSRDQLPHVSPPNLSFQQCYAHTEDGGPAYKQGEHLDLHELPLSRCVENATVNYLQEYGTFVYQLQALQGDGVKVRFCLLSPVTYLVALYDFLLREHLTHLAIRLRHLPFKSGHQLQLL
jgi:hypothetical protein